MAEVATACPTEAGAARTEVLAAPTSLKRRLRSGSKRNAAMRRCRTDPHLQAIGKRRLTRARSETEVYILTGFPLAADSYIARTMASECRADSPLTYGSRSSSMA